MRTLAVLVVAVLLHHILIFHPFFFDKALDDHGSLPMYDMGLSPELTDDNDTISFHDRRGVPAPVLSLGISAFGDHIVHQLLLNAAAEHPPKA